MRASRRPPARWGSFAAANEVRGPAPRCWLGSLRAGAGAQPAAGLAGGALRGPSTRAGAPSRSDRHAEFEFRGGGGGVQIASLSGSSCSDEEELPEDEEEAPEVRPMVATRADAARGGGGGGGGPALLQVLLLDALQERVACADAVRSLPLVARDVASLIVALGVRASSPEARALWGAVCAAGPSDAAGADDAPATALDAVVAVQRMCLQHPDRDERIALNDAKRTYRLTSQEAEVGAAQQPGEWTRSGVSSHAAPLARRVLPMHPQALPYVPGKWRRRMVSLLSVKALAHRRYGDVAGLAAARKAAQARRARAHQKHRSNFETRRGVLAARCVLPPTLLPLVCASRGGLMPRPRRLAAEGLAMPASDGYGSWELDHAHTRFLSSGKQLAELMDEIRAEIATRVRRAALLAGCAPGGMHALPAWALLRAADSRCHGGILPCRGAQAGGRGAWRVHQQRPRPRVVPRAGRRSHGGGGGLGAGAGAGAGGVRGAQAPAGRVPARQRAGAPGGARGLRGVCGQPPAGRGRGHRHNGPP